MQKKKSILQVVVDGWENVLTGIGIRNRDKTRSTTYGAVVRIDQITATDLHRGDGFGKKVIDLPVREMFREWITIEGDTDGFILKDLSDIKAKQNLRDAKTWAEVFGGALVVMIIDDGGMLEDELREDSIKKVVSLQVYDRWQVSWTTADQYNDPEHEKFGKAEFFTIQPLSLPFFRVHESRTLLFDGKLVPERIRRLNNGWGDSAYQCILERLKAVGATYIGAENILDEFVNSTLTIDNLQDLVASGQEELILKRLNLIDMSRHIINTTILDKDEKFEKYSATVTGLADLLDRMTEALAAVTEIPVTLLMGRNQKGLSSGGAQQTDLRNWYDKISGQQENELMPQHQRLVNLVAISSEGRFTGKIDGLQVVFLPLWQPSEAEIVVMRNKQAETDRIYVQEGILAEDEVANSRFGGDTYSIETALDKGITDRTEPELKSEPDNNNNLLAE